MKKTIKMLTIMFIMVIISCLSEVNATELQVDTQYKINVELKDSIKRSTYNELLSKESTLEETYNLKEKLKNINVKNQKGSGACWAFSFSTILETSIDKKYNKVSKEYSPMHIEYVTTQMFERTLGSGANPRLSTAYCVSGHGPVEESQMPFASVYDDTTGYKNMENVGNLNATVVARIKDTIEFPNIHKKINNNTIQYFSDSSCTKSYTSSEVQATRELIKKHIKTNGAITAEIYMNQANYYNVSTASYNYNEYSNKQLPNHVVTIVGWDDNYSVDKFKDGKKPINKGAYIALNSYGTDWGDGGYMYISYEDACIEETLMGIKDIEQYENNKKDYDKIYQYDELGMNMGVPLGGENIYAANKYTRQKIDDKDEYIQEIGLYIINTSGVEVYMNSASDDINNTKLVAKPLEALESGYHTIKFAEPIKLTGDKFAIKVKYTNQEGAYVPMEVNYKNFGLEGTNAFFNKATANDGECFVSKDGSEWHDVNKTVINSGGKQYSLTNSSTCIKAFTTYQTKEASKPNKLVERIELNKSSIEIKKGDKFNLTVSFYPTDATNKKIKWKTSDEKIASVSDTGIITAHSEGSVTITATTEDGNKTASCTITVKENLHQDDDIIYKDNDTLNNSSKNKEISIKNYSPNNNSAINKDNSLSNKLIPYAGNSVIMIVAIIIVSITGIIIFIKMRAMKDVK